MHPILILILAIPILIGIWMVIRGMRTSTREQKLSVLKWILVIGLFATSAYLAWSGLWRRALGVLGSLFLFLWNWRKFLVWFADNVVKKHVHNKIYGTSSDTKHNMNPAREPGRSMPKNEFNKMSRKEAMDILGLSPKYTESDVNTAWEAMLRKIHASDSAEVAHPASLINAVHKARAVLLETLER